MFDMIDIVTDVAMLTLLGIPILGLVAMGATALQPLMGSVGSGRKKREVNGLIDKAGQAILYARNLYDILANLDDAFLKYDITSNACQLKAICEVHKWVTRSFSSLKDVYDILDEHSPLPPIVLIDLI